ncbi:Endonuclease/exonuclease/phosphatase, partial [Irpex lacteus]
KIASLNMRGHGTAPLGDPQNKWAHVKNLVRNNKIGILALQETHLTSTNPERPNAHGVAIIVNKHLLPTDDLQSWEIIPGRAIQIKLRWHKDNYLNVLAVYAPNDPTKNAEFWAEIRGTIEDKGLTKPDITLGDFNLVEDKLDRQPSHSDPNPATTALRELMDDHELSDGWRSANPETKAFTFGLNNLGSKSRIDRIYVTKTLLDSADEWKVTHSDGVDTDHQLVSVKISNADAPYVGKGRWVMPKLLLQDREIKTYIHETGLALETTLDETELNRTEVNNPQRAFKTWKEELTKKLRQRARVAVPKIVAKIRSLQTNLDTMLQGDPVTRDEADDLSIALIQQKIKELTKLRADRAHIAGNAKFRLEGETISKYWSKVNQDTKPRDIIYSLQRPADVNGEPAIEATRSDRMAELARDYHEHLQNQGIDAEHENDRQEAITAVLAAIQRTFTAEEQADLALPVNSEEVRLAIRASENGKATGIDGLPYELWKTIDQRYLAAKKLEKPTFNIVRTLTRVYNDIATHGMDEQCGFTDGWMCPIFKPNKADRKRIENYRPITLLNSDQKIMTKAIAARL